MPYYWGASHASAAFALNTLVPQPVLGRPLVTGSSNPITLSDFDLLITLVEGEVGAAFAEGGYTFPVSTVASVAFVWTQKVVKDGALAALLDTIPGQAPTASEMRKAYEAALKLIADSNIAILADSGGRQLPRGGGIASPVISASWQP